ncbi:MAG: glycosyltransferase family 4 protein [bacterium]|nr:glycosyltransferase family 4 protein [bacterium]
MRVLHVMEATIGGTRRHIVDVARGQLREGVSVHLAVSTLRDPGFPADLEALEAEGVHVERIPMVRAVRPATDWRHYRRLVHLIRELRPDIVHTHSSKAGVLGRRASIAAGIGARVHTPHTFAFLFEALFGRVKRGVYRELERHLARRTERLIAVSETEAESFRASGVVAAERVRVVPNAIDASRFQGAAPIELAELGLDPARPTTAVIGLVYAAKGQDLALDALARAGCEDLQLLVVGPGDTAELEARARALGVVDRVRFTGPREDVPSVLAALDFLLLPSRWEGMPYIVLEAMASGLPVVATPVDGARELVREGSSGFLASAIETDAVHAALVRACAASSEERVALGAAGRARVLADFSLERMVRGLLDVYAEIA